MQNKLDKNLADANFVLNHRKEKFPLGGVNRKDLYESDPLPYLEQHQIIFAIRAIELLNKKGFWSSNGDVERNIQKVFARLGYVFKDHNNMLQEANLILPQLEARMKGGFCRELCLYTLFQMKKIAPHLSIEAGIFSTSTHTVLIFGRNDPSSAVICDLWAETIYPLSELKSKQKRTPDIPTVALQGPDQIGLFSTCHFLDGNLQLEKTLPLEVITKLQREKASTANPKPENLTVTNRHRFHAQTPDNNPLPEYGPLTGGYRFP